LKGTRTTFWAA